jgi:hypothetical protein
MNPTRVGGSTTEPVPKEVDVAFSLLAQDEGITSELSRLLQDSAGTFLFTERQKDLAGTDGVAELTHLYAEGAKLVVVLYREGYGKTKWTRIEESAVTSRGLNLGWDSLLLISLDGTKPKWLPASRLWYGIDQFGVRTAADVVRARLHDVVEAGRPKSLVEQAKALGQQLDSQQEAERWRDSEAAVRAATEELDSLRQFLKNQVAAINEAAPNLGLSYFEPERDVVGVRCGTARVTFGYFNQYSNTVRHAYIFVRELELPDREFLPIPQRFDRNFEPTREVHMRLSLAHGGLRVWTADEEPDRSFTTRELAEWHIKKLLQRLGGI